MSQFKTVIPFDVKPILDALPKGAYVHGAKFNPAASCIEVVWEHDPWRTGFTFPMEMSIEEIKARVATEPAPKPAPEPAKEANVQTLEQVGIDPEPAKKQKRSRVRDAA